MKRARRVALVLVALLLLELALFFAIGRRLRRELEGPREFLGRNSGTFLLDPNFGDGPLRSPSGSGMSPKFG
jgi:hypothetical protein